jgi:hypothetical protein
MVHFPGLARAHLWIQWAVRRFYQRGFPHSDIPGSRPACGSPRLIAACHVLHRHRLPRHPPCALSSLTIKFTQPTRLRGSSVVNFMFLAACSSPDRKGPTPAGYKALIKNSPCSFTQSIQLSNIVRHSRGARLGGWTQHLPKVRRHRDGVQLRAGSGGSGGADRVRTGDPLLAKQVLSQLSYSPDLSFQFLVSSF